jgi:hypothetical protein
MLRNQLLALCKQRRQKGISCAGDVGETEKTQNGSPDFRSVCPELVLANRRRFSDTMKVPACMLLFVPAGVALIALKDDPLRGGWLRGSPPFGWTTNATMRAEEFSRIWAHLEAELPTVPLQAAGSAASAGGGAAAAAAVSVGDIRKLRGELESQVDEEAVVQQEHIGKKTHLCGAVLYYK